MEKGWRGFREGREGDMGIFGREFLFEESDRGTWRDLIGFGEAYMGWGGGD